jgi:predicted ATP-grasp superfamily ATP-dependent carboligase
VPNNQSHLAYEPKPPNVVGSYLLPVLATISALSFMAAASAGIGVWKDVSVMRVSMSTLIKNSDIQQKQYKEVMEQLQEHEIRLTKGKL